MIRGVFGTGGGGGRDGEFPCSSGIVSFLISDRAGNERGGGMLPRFVSGLSRGELIPAGRCRDYIA